MTCRERLPTLPLPMEYLRKLGRALQALRAIRGLGIREAAGAAGLAPADIQDAEAGRGTRACRERLASFYGVDVDDLMERTVSIASGNGSATVFLLHGPLQDFDAADLDVLDRAMRAGRILATRVAAGRQGLHTRRELMPVPPAGPLPRDAAIQGHKLARRLRAHLGLDKDRIGDVRDLLEARLGVAVTVDAMASMDLRAAAILDAERVSAAAVLAANDDSRKRNPTLARVFLAHELCHLAFDPGAPGLVQIALDDHPQSQAGRNTSLLESRAKGFAAELLIPKAGLMETLGPPRAEGSIAAARRMVKDTAEHFGTPNEIATWHLKNLGFITDEAAFELVADKTALSAASIDTRLPEPGAMPICIETHAEARGTWALPDDSLEVPEPVRQVRMIAQEENEGFLRAILEAACDEIARDLPIAATDRLAERLDTLLLAGDFGLAGTLLERIDVMFFPPQVLTGVLTTTAPAREPLGGAYRSFRDRVLAALESTWKLPPERRERIARRFP